MESECSSRCWFARVPSQSTVGDGPSRSEAGVVASGSIRTTPVTRKWNGCEKMFEIRLKLLSLNGVNVPPKTIGG